MTSKLGEGSTFWFELPLQVDTAHGRSKLEVPRGRVVVIGGRDSAAGLAERLLRLGCQARWVATAESAAELLRHADDRPAVVVCDRAPPVDIAALEALLATISPVEPIDIIAVGRDAPGDAAPILVDLPSDVADPVLMASLRAATRRPPIVPGQASLPPTPDTGRPRRTLNVLVAEDNRTNQKVIGKILEHAGHRATIVATGQDAVEALEEPGFDLVLMDLNMPELGGIEAVKLLRFTHDLDELPPIVALSADATLQTREACRAVGFSAYLTKPVDTQLLLRTLDELTQTAVATLQPTHDPADGVFAAAVDITPKEPAQPALDTRRLTSLAELDRGDGFLDGLVDDFVADLDKMLAELAQAAADGNARVFRDQAHALRSSAAHIGALALFDVCLGWRELDDHALLMRAPVELARLQREARRAALALATFKQDWRLDSSGLTGRA